MISIIFGLIIFIPMPKEKDIVCFTLNPYKEYCGTLLDFKYTEHDVRLTVELDPETWETADLLMFFNLKWDKRNPGTISGTKPVQISMFLDRQLFQKLKASDELLTDKNAYMKANLEHPMRGTSAWFATEVTEEVELPEELKNKGTLREGFTTHWKDSE